MEKKTTKEEIDILKHEIADLKEIVKTQELLKLREENSRLKEYASQIGKVRLKLKDIRVDEMENEVRVRYEIPPLVLKIGSKNDLVRDEQFDIFYAINILRLLTFEDLAKVQKVINDLHKEDGEWKQ